MLYATSGGSTENGVPILPETLSPARAGLFLLRFDGEQFSAGILPSRRGFLFAEASWQCLIRAPGIPLVAWLRSAIRTASISLCRTLISAGASVRCTTGAGLTLGTVTGRTALLAVGASAAPEATSGGSTSCASPRRPEIPARVAAQCLGEALRRRCHARGGRDLKTAAGAIAVRSAAQFPLKAYTSLSSIHPRLAGPTMVPASSWRLGN